MYAKTRATHHLYHQGKVHKIQLTSYISRLFQNELKTDLAAASVCNMSDHPSGAAEAFLKLGAEEELVHI